MGYIVRYLLAVVAVLTLYAVFRLAAIYICAPIYGEVHADGSYGSIGNYAYSVGVLLWPAFVFAASCSAALMLHPARLGTRIGRSALLASTALVVVMMWLFSSTFDAVAGLYDEGRNGLTQIPSSFGDQITTPMISLLLLLPAGIFGILIGSLLSRSILRIRG
jgi:hypothetical protein